MLKDENYIDFKEVPALIWQPSYDKPGDGVRQFHKHIQHVSDFLLSHGSTLWTSGDNGPDLYLTYKGKIDKKKYKRAAETWGLEGSAPIRDFSFYQSTSQTLLGTKLQMPFEFDVTDVGEKEMKRRLAMNTDFASEQAARQAIGMVAQQGIDLSFAANEDMHIPKSEEEIDQVLNGPSDNEVRMYKLLKDQEHSHSITQELLDCLEDKFIVNGQFAEISHEDGRMWVKRLNADSVSWIATVDRLKSLEEADAVGRKRYISMNEALSKYGHLFDGRKSIQAVIDTVRGLNSENRKDWNSTPFSYNPERLWLGGSDITSIMAGDRNYNTPGYFNWQEVFYPHIGGNHLSTRSVLEHKINFKMLRHRRVKVLINGKNATSQTYEEYRNRNYDGKLKARFVPVEDDYRKKPGEMMARYPDYELWEATRLGHCVLVDVKRCAHADKDLKRTSPTFPIVGRINSDRSMVNMGQWFAMLDNVIFNRIEELLNLGGASSALMVDEAQMGKDEILGMYHGAKKAAIVRYNSIKANGLQANPMATRHLTMVKLTDENKQVSDLLALGGMLKMTFDSMIGVGPERQGQGGKYDSGGKVNTLIGQQSLLTEKFFYEDALFVQECLQRVTQMARVYYAKDSYQTLRVDGDTAEIVRFDSSFAEGDYRVDYRNGVKLLAKKQKLEQMAQAVLPSGGVEAIEAIVDIIFEDSPLEARRVFKQGLEALRQTQNAAAEAQGQAAQGRNQVEGQKVEIEKYKADLASQTDLQIAQMKMGQKEQETDAQGDMLDVKNAATMQQMAAGQGMTPEQQQEGSPFVELENQTNQNQ